MSLLNFAYLLFLTVTVKSSPPIYFEETGIKLLTDPVVEPFADEADNYRLPEGIIGPHFYNLELSFENDFFVTQQFRGQLDLLFQLVNTTSEIKLHTNDINITTVSLTTEGGSVVPITDSNDLNTTTDIRTIHLGRTLSLAPTVYILSFDYIGRIRSSPLNGIYLSSYQNVNNQTRYLASTQFESTSARKAFPSFDEPAFKARYNITIRHPSEYSAKSNTKEQVDLDPERPTYRITTFPTTPIMPTYLLAFIISDFTCGQGADIEPGIESFVCSKDNDANIRDLAIDYGPRVLWALEDFTDVKYSTFQLNKMYQFGIPDFSAGAMENWGICTYREYYVLWDPLESSNSYKQNVLTIVAHEFAHQWFGDLVTIKWWSDIFLNEGWATYFEWIVAAKVEPAWELEKQFVLQELHPALISDASASSNALHTAASTQSQISNRFDTISYSKGGSILRVVEHFIGLDNFKSGIKLYLDRHAFGNTEPADLWGAFAEVAPAGVLPPGTTLQTVMDAWTYSPGFPILEVTSNGNTVTVSQRRFLHSTANSSIQWYVPITYTTNGADSQDTATKAWLVPGVNLIITLQNADDWIVLNNQQIGYYRVNYDDNLWRKLTAALARPGFDGISDSHRSQIVHDLYIYARYIDGQFAKFFTVTAFLKKDTSYFSWYPFLTAFNYILGRVGNTNLRIVLSNYVLELLEILYNAHPFYEPRDDDQIYTLNRVQAINWGCRLGFQDCIDKAKASFKSYRETNIKPDKNLWSQIYCNDLRQSDDIPGDWNFLFGKYQESTSTVETSTLFSALGCASNETVLIEFLRKSITANGGIRAGDNLNVFSSIANGNRERGTDVALEFLIDNYDAIDLYYSGTNSVISLISDLAGRLTRPEQADKLETFIDEKIKDNQKPSASSSLQAARNNLISIEEFERGLISHFIIAGQSASAETTKLSIIVATLLLLCYQLFY